MSHDLETFRCAAADIAGAFDLRLVYLFGSAAAGKPGSRLHRESDIDIAVLRDPARRPNRLTTEDLLEISARFIQLAPGRPVDVVDLEHANPLLRYQVCRGILLHGDREVAERQGMLALHIYEDYRPYFRLEETTVLNVLGFSGVGPGRLP